MYTKELEISLSSHDQTDKNESKLKEKMTQKQMKTSQIPHNK